MEAKVTFSMTPAEFDLLRSAVEKAADAAMEVAVDRTAPVREREKHRTRSVRLHDLLKKMK